MTRLARTATVAGLAAALTMGMLAAGAAADDAPVAKPQEPGSFVVGSAGGKLAWEGYKDHPVRFTVDARTPSDGNPLKAKGRFRVTHKTATGGPFADFRGEIDCLVAGGKTAVVTGVIKEGGISAMPGVDVIGKRVGFTISDEGRRHDRIGWSWAVAGFESVPQCMSTAPFFQTTTGDYRVGGTSL
ncbi:hypothetical protein [Actinomadura rudentiformis]|uniref:Repetin n=1 Tax=Actinomadura rudentiformis TaxID=359158 RepID=A0A6H9YGT9_9ACTN|nr:hypothetical protein [Actinomadura rudentiformis]KAB2341301.1 hypothetical protein F8566_42030 [Actinomadura rudentiformis]